MEENDSRKMDKLKLGDQGEISLKEVSTVKKSYTLRNKNNEKKKRRRKRNYNTQSKDKESPYIPIKDTLAIYLKRKV